ncbi:MAG: NHL repeat-containing protein [Planctomycetota bacterium]
MDFSKTQFRATRIRFTTIMVIALILVVLGAGPLDFLPGLDDMSSQAYAKPVSIEGDICGSSRIGFAEFAVLASHWLRTDCNTPDWCGGTDFDHNNTVDRIDLKIFARSWLWLKSGDFSVQNTNNYPTRLAIGPDGKFYVSDAQAGAVFVYNAGLDLIGVLKGLENPLGIAVDAEGNIYVGNNRQDKVEVYSCRGGKIATVGGGLIRMPNDMAFDLSGNLYVVDSADNKIKVFDSQGQNIKNIAADTPVSLAISSYIDSNSQEVGELFVAEMKLARISVFDLNGNYDRSIGRKVSTFGSFWHGRFVKLQSLAIDSQGRLHALDCYLNKVQILDAQDGTFLGSYPSGEEPDHTKLLLDVVLKDPNTAVLTDSENKRLQVFQY